VPPVPAQPGIPHTIPERTGSRTDSRTARLRNCACDGRAPDFDEQRYKKRNTVE